MEIQRVEFILEYGEAMNSKIKVQKLRGIFPNAEVMFTVHTDDGKNHETKIVENGRLVPYFKLGDWFGKRSDQELLKGKFAIEVVELMHKYKLTIIPS